MQDFIKLKQQLEILWQEVERLERETPEPGPGGTSDYTELTNKPSINSIELNGNKTLAQLGIASASALSSLVSQFDDLFAVDNVSVVSDGEYPSTLDSRLVLHQPINLNNVNYYFFEETGIDYSYFAIDTSGAYPKISLAQLLKDSHRVVFYEFATDTAPTDNSDNFITSGAVYTALSGKADSSSVYTKSEIDTALGNKANSSDVYTKTQVDIKVGGYTAESDNGSFSSLLHSAATYCGVDDTKEVNGFVIFTSSITSENLIGFFNFKYLRNVVFSQVISNTITYNTQSQYGTITVTGGTGPYKAVVKFI